MASIGGFLDRPTAAVEALVVPSQRRLESVPVGLHRSRRISLAMSDVPLLAMRTFVNIELRSIAVVRHHRVERYLHRIVWRFLPTLGVPFSRTDDIASHLHTHTRLHRSYGRTCEAPRVVIAPRRSEYLEAFLTKRFADMFNNIAHCNPAAFFAKRFHSASFCVRRVSIRSRRCSPSF